MKKLTMKLLSCILILSMTMSLSVSAFVTANSNIISEIQKLVQLAEVEREIYGEAKDNTINQLQTKLENLGVDMGSYSGVHSIILDTEISVYGYGETHNIKRGWTYRVDKPSASDAKPHVHVDNKKLNIHGVENVDGTPSHGKTLSGSKVPKDIQKEVKGSNDYKKGQKDLGNMKKAKQEIKSKHLDLSFNKDLLIAAGIFVIVVGVAFVAPEFIPALLSGI